MPNESTSLIPITDEEKLNTAIAFLSMNVSATWLGVGTLALAVGSTTNFPPWVINAIGGGSFGVSTLITIGLLYRNPGALTRALTNKRYLPSYGVSFLTGLFSSGAVMCANSTYTEKQKEAGGNEETDAKRFGLISGIFGLGSLANMAYLTHQQYKNNPPSASA